MPGRSRRASAGPTARAGRRCHPERHPVLAHGVRDVTRPARDGVEPDEDDAPPRRPRRPSPLPDGRRDGRGSGGRGALRTPPGARQPAAVRAEAAPRDGDQGDPGDRGPGPAEKRWSEDRRDEEHRLEQVGDAVEAPCLRGAERGQRDGLGVEAEDQQVGGQDGGAGEPERQDHRRRRDERDEPPAGEPEVRGQPEQDDPRCEARRDHRHDVGQRADEQRQGEPDAVVPLDPVLEPGQGGDGVADGDDLEPAVRDVGERHEPVDPRRARREDSARPGDHRDGVAGVLASARRRKDDERVGRRSRAELDQRRPPGRAAEQRAHDRPGEQCVERALAGDGGACARDGEPDRPAARVAVEREGLDDAHARRRLRGDDEGQGGRGEDAGHGEESRPPARVA